MRHSRGYPMPWRVSFRGGGPMPPRGVVSHGPPLVLPPPPPPPPHPRAFHSVLSRGPPPENMRPPPPPSQLLRAGAWALLARWWTGLALGPVATPSMRAPGRAGCLLLAGRPRASPTRTRLEALVGEPVSALAPPPPGKGPCPESRSAGVAAWGTAP